MKQNLSLRREYDEKIVSSRKSSDMLFRKRQRRFLILVWLAASIVIGFAFYWLYAKDAMADNAEEKVSPIKVETGIELSEDAGFGPWMSGQKIPSK